MSKSDGPGSRDAPRVVKNAGDTANASNADNADNAAEADHPENAAARALDNPVERRGASKTDLSDRRRAIQRRVMLTVPRLRQLGMRGRELSRKLRGEPHRIEFYHQVDDPYSHLALEAIGDLLDRYEVECRFFLVSQTDLKHAPEPTLLGQYALRDCALVAEDYGLTFPKSGEAAAGTAKASDATSSLPARETVERVEALLARLVGDPCFRDVALEAGRALWSADKAELEKIEARTPTATAGERQSTIADGNARRTRKQHYSGGMFWYAGEWFWGVDRLHHLERRLGKLGAARTQDTQLRFDRPPIDPGKNANAGRLRLEVFPSLRSPYTAMIFDRTLEMAASVDVPVTLRPVLPMVMRGVPAPFAKGIYIMSDAKREADQLGVPFGDMFDPIGRPVERGLSLWPFARDEGRGAEFISAFLRAAFAEGRNTGSDEGIRSVVEDAGLSFAAAKAHLDSNDWRAEIEENRKVMYDELGLWGVPSYRLVSENNPDEADFSVWGQDRLWRVAAEIRRRLA
ncbi:MAG: DsbA family protein [Myxococcota bacterium]